MREESYNGIAFVLAVLMIFVLVFFAPAIINSHPDTVALSISSMLGAGFGVFGAFAVATATFRRSDREQPRLRVVLDQVAYPACVRVMPSTVFRDETKVETDTTWVRPIVVLDAGRAAHDCELYITKLRFTSYLGDEFIYADDPVRLGLAYNNGSRLAGAVPVFANLFWVAHDLFEGTIPLGGSAPQYFIDATTRMRHAGSFAITLLLVGANFEPITTEVSFTWHPNSAKITIP